MHSNVEISVNDPFEKQVVELLNKHEFYSERAVKKEWFVSVKHMQPSELEYYLEAQAANGYILKKLGELAPFYYEFEEGEKTKTKFVVDKTALAKDMYVDTLTGKGWELMGTVGPFYLWRQDYTDKRPKDFTDSAIRGKACKALSIGALIITLISACILFLVSNSLSSF